MDVCAVVVILDGLNRKVLEDSKPPTLSKLAKEGFYSVYRTVVPSVTYSAHTSIATGELPIKHGIPGNAFIDRGSGEAIDMDVVPISSVLRAETMFEKAKRLGAKTAVIGEPAFPGADFLVTMHELQKYGPERKAEVTADLIREAVEKGSNLIMANFASFDNLGETKGPFHPSIRSLLEWFDSFLSELLSLLKRKFRDYLVIITADHGMVEVKERVDVSRELESYCNCRAFPSHRAVHIYTDELPRAVEGLINIGVEEFFLGGAVERLGLPRDRSGDIVAFAPPGLEFGDAEKGSHGGLTPDEMEVALFSSKPEFPLRRTGVVTDVAKAVVDFLTEAVAYRFAAERMKGSDPGHDASHAIRVLRTATELGRRYGADLKALRLAAILHDVGRLDARGSENHAEASARIAKEFLERIAGRELAEKVSQIIVAHESPPNEGEGLEIRILRESDKLDCLGVIGLVRALLEAGWKGESLEEAVNHVLTDTKKLGSFFTLPETKWEFERRSKLLEAVLDEIRRECGE